MSTLENLKQEKWLPFVVKGRTPEKNNSDLPGNRSTRFITPHSG